jgi:2-dehydropantoate 2-reductase
VVSEVDYLNGEIVRLARLHGIPAPLNAAFQQAAAALARVGGTSASAADTATKFLKETGNVKEAQYRLR